jgi:hypothetical protein
MLVSGVETVAETACSDKLDDEPVIDRSAGLFRRARDLAYPSRTKAVPANDRIRGCYLREFSPGLYFVLIDAREERRFLFDG